MSDKVKLPKEVAEAIDREVLRLGKDSLFQIIASMREEPLFNGTHVTTLMMGNDEQKLIYWHFKGKLLQLANGLNVGYEIEQTPEDKVRWYYESCLEKIRYAKDSHESKEYQAKHDAIKKVLDILKIKIKGVNDHD